MEFQFWFEKTCYIFQSKNILYSHFPIPSPAQPHISILIHVNEIFYNERSQNKQHIFIVND